MGFDVKRFENLGDLEDELICSICMGVFEEPYILVNCGHTFCKQCIETWFDEKRSCPNDGTNVGFYRELVPAPIPLKNIICKLNIHCDYEEQGCTEVVQLQNLKRHNECCTFKPKPPPITPQKTIKRLVDGVVNFFSQLVPVLSQTVQQRNERETRRRVMHEFHPIQMLMNYQLDLGVRRVPERPQRRRTQVTIPSSVMQRYIVLFAFLVAFVVCAVLVVSMLLIHFIDNIVSSFILPCCVVFLTLYVITKFIESEPDNRPSLRRAPFD